MVRGVVSGVRSGVACVERVSNCCSIIFSGLRYAIIPALLFVEVKRGLFGLCLF